MSAGTAATATTEKNEYRNVSGVVQGVIVETPEGPEAVAVKPNDTVWLSESERIRTANAPKHEKYNPFGNGAFEKVTEGQAIKSKRQIDAPAAADATEAPPVPAADTTEPPAGPGGPPAEERPPAPVTPPEEEIGATPPPATAPQEGQRAPGEEVATPSAPQRAEEAARARQAAPASSPAPEEDPVPGQTVRSGPPAAAKAARPPEGPTAVKQTAGGLAHTPATPAGV